MGQHESFGQLDARIVQALDYDKAAAAPADGNGLGWWSGANGGVGGWQPQAFVTQYQRGPLGGTSAATLVTQTYAFDATGAVFRRWTLTGNPTLSIPTGGVDGQKVVLWLLASGADRTLTFASGYETSPLVPNRSIVIANGTWERVEIECRNGTWRLINTDQLLFAAADIGAAAATHATNHRPGGSDPLLGNAASVQVGNTGAATTTTSTTYAAIAGTGVAFVAPPSGKVTIEVSALLLISTAGSGCFVTPVVLAGATIGSGTSTLAAADPNAVSNNNTQYVASSRTTLVTGLTPGASYNAQAYRRVSANTGTTAYERILVTPEVA